jgi:hypothetical protein
MSFNYKAMESTNSTYAFSRLIDHYNTHNRLIVAYDVDDTVRPYYSGSCEKVKSVLRAAAQYLNCYFIVYTCNPNTDKIKEYLIEEELPFDSINENAPFTPNYINGKLFYNIFLDDKAGLNEAVERLEALIHYIINGGEENENIEG